MRWICSFALFLSLTSAIAADTPGLPTVPTLPPGFDPVRHMRVAEVREGMTGYGISVFKDAKLERFSVKVLSVLHNFNPKYDVVLITCKGANLEHTGSIAGMSGSPIYLTDDQGRSRLIGAFAYGWPMMKDPVAGVQPIEYMLGIPTRMPSTQPIGQGIKSAHALAQMPGTHPHCSLDEFMPMRASNHHPAIELPTVAARLGFSGPDVPHLQPLATPLMAGGLSKRIVQQLNDLMGGSGMVALQAGGLSGGHADGPSPKLEPGSVLAVPLMTGDVEMTAIGTCTDVIHDSEGERIVGFGHSFNNEGPIDLPMGSGRINAVIANLSTSFKIGESSGLQGSLLADQTVGVAGRIGTAPPMVPMTLHVDYVDAGESQVYHFQLAHHSKLTPMLAAAAFMAAASGTHDPPEFYTIDYDLQMDFTNGQSIHVANSTVNAAVPDLFNEIGIPIVAAAQNPFEIVGLKAIDGTLRISSEAREAHIDSVTLPRLKYQPGETAKLFLQYRPFRENSATMPIDFEIPRELPDGVYQLVVTDWEQYLEGEKQIRPFRFTADSGPELFAALKDLLGVRHDAVYVQLMRKPDGVAIGRTAMPHLPSSRREVLLGAGVSDTTAFVSSTLKIVPTNMVMDGAANFSITIDHESKVESTSGVKTSADHNPPAKAKEPKKSVGIGEPASGAQTQPSK
jgi:hypothetical protein